MNLDFSSIKVLLIGDFMLDHYIMGNSSRMSPEAPVPVVIPSKKFSVPGGAGNVAINLSSIGINVTCIGTVGDDRWGKELVKILKTNKVQTSGIEVIKNHITTVKQRIYSNNEQIARIDYEKFLEYRKYPDEISCYDICLLSDYNKGVISNAKFNSKRIIVDPKKDDFSLYKNAHIITPNINELNRASNKKIHDEKSLVYACSSLIEKYNFKYIVAKKGNKGITVVGKNNLIFQIEPHFVEDPDVTGAGDTVISVLSAVYAKTNDIEFAARVANKAASIVVGRKGTAMITLDDLSFIRNF